MLNEFISELVDTLNANGGSMEYEALYNAVDPIDRSKLPKALAQAKAEGTISKIVAWDSATSTLTHTVSLGGA